MAQNRRSFLKSAGVAAAITAAAPLALGLPGSPSQPAGAAAPGRSYSAGKFSMELDGVSVGVLRSFAGGFPFGKVIEFHDATNLFADKLIDGVAYEDMVLEVSEGMGVSFWNWLAAMISGNPLAKSGAIKMLDQNNEVHGTLQFQNALIAGIEFPALDASSKDPAVLKVTITPDSTVFKPASGKSVPAVNKSKKWLVSNFKLDVDGLPTKRVAKIESFSIKQQIIEFRPGDGGQTQHLPGKLEYPNLVFSVPEVDAQAWLDYFESFVLQGNQGVDNEKTGSIVFLSPDLKEELMRLSLAGLGIFKCAPTAEESSKEKIQSFSPEMYAERMTLAATGISA